MTLDVRRLGRIGYEEALQLQTELVETRLNEEIPDTLLLLEHPPVITMGKSAHAEDILASQAELDEAGAEIHRINRGGETTYHGPGQLVGYLIFHLYNHQRSIKRFIRKLEGSFINLLSDYGIEGSHDPDHRGVWVGEEKITAIGIAIKRGVTMHGFAFNVAPNLDHFDWIIPCGIRDRGQTSMARLLDRSIGIEDVSPALVTHMAAEFGYDTVTDGTEPSRVGLL
jgi:lipoyl(octanoyl) transferase